MNYTGSYPLESEGYHWRYVCQLTEGAALQWLNDTVPEASRIPTLDEFLNKCYVIVSHDKGELQTRCGKVTAVYAHDCNYYLISKGLGLLTERELQWLEWVIEQEGE